MATRVQNTIDEIDERCADLPDLSAACDEKLRMDLSYDFLHVSRIPYGSLAKIFHLCYLYEMEDDIPHPWRRGKEEQVAAAADTTAAAADRRATWRMWHLCG